MWEKLAINLSCVQKDITTWENFEDKENVLLYLMLAQVMEVLLASSQKKRDKVKSTETLFIYLQYECDVVT